MPLQRKLGQILRIGALGVASASLVGCAANYSNPTLSITSAQVSGDSATLEVIVSNPSGVDLTLKRIDYSLLYGPLPVADGVYSTLHTLPKGGEALLTISIPFDSPPIDPSASSLVLSGQMTFDDASTSGNMALEAASFEAVADIDR